MPNDTFSSLTLTLTKSVIPFKIYCKANGYPMPTVEWKFNGNEMVPSGVIQNKVMINVIQ